MATLFYPALRVAALSPLALCLSQVVWAQTAAAPAESGKALSTVTVNASADASAEGLSPAYAGGQVARGGRAGILGTRDTMETPFSITSYTNELIQDRQAKSVGEVLLNDPSVRTARGFGNFQEAYFVRGFILNSDDTAYNGLYSLLPRQYIATELFERVEVLRGASAFLTGASPNGSLGGAINLLPKRAPNEPLTRVTVGVGSGGAVNAAADIARRFGPDGSTGVRLNVARRDGGTAVSGEDAELSLAAIGLDWRSRNVRLSGDLGWQENKLRETRPNVSLVGAGAVPARAGRQQELRPALVVLERTRRVRHAARRMGHQRQPDGLWRLRHAPQPRTQLAGQPERQRRSHRRRHHLPLRQRPPRPRGHRRDRPARQAQDR